MNTFHAVIVAAGRHDDECLPWIKEVETSKPEDLENPGDSWLCLDRKLASALMKIASGEMGKKMTLASNAAVSSGSSMRGRVLLQMIFQYYSAGHDGQVLYDMNHLQSLCITNGNLEAFHNTWTMVLSELEFPPPPGSLKLLYAKQIATYTPMKEDYNHYNRARWNPNSNGDWTFEWL